MNRLKALLLVFFVLGVGYVARLSWQEQDYGRGARDTSRPVAGASREVAFVANSLDGTVTLIDLDDSRVMDTLDVTPDGKRVGLLRDPGQWLLQGYLESRSGLNYVQDTDLSRDGTVLYVSRGYLGDVVAIDIDTGGVLWRTPVSGFRADHMTLSPDGKRLYVSALIFGGNVVDVLDSASGEHVGEIQAGLWPHDVHVSPDGKRVYVASLGNMMQEVSERDEAPDAYRVTVADADTLIPVRQYDFDAGVRPFAVTRDGRRLYAQLSNAHAVVSRDLESGKPLGRLELPILDGVDESDWDFEAPHHGLALTPDESLLCLAGRASDYAAIVATNPFMIKHLVPVGNGPSWAALDSAGTRCVLPNTRSNDVSIVDMVQGKEIAHLRVGQAPKHVTVGDLPTVLLD